MSEQQPNKNGRESSRLEQPSRPVLLVPRSYVVLIALVVAASIFVTLFVRNPYTQSVSGDYYERSSLDGAIVWAVIFIGLPGLWFGYQKWVAPRLKKKL